MVPSLGGEVVVGGCSKPLRLLNAFLEEAGVKTVNQLQLEWNKCTDRTKRRYAQQTADILVAVLCQQKTQDTFGRFFRHQRL